MIEKKDFLPIQFKENKLLLLDQRKLPTEEVFVTCTTLEDGHDAIADMVVRGAPCIGFSAIFSLALWFNDNSYSFESFKQACIYLKGARPTAVNLEFEVENILNLVESWNKEGLNIQEEIISYGFKAISLSEEKNLKMAKFAAKELQRIYGSKKLKVLTHCNTGFLACGSMGTALGVIEHLHHLDLLEKVWVDETRPYLQGSRLTAYELSKLGIDYDIVVEGAASYLMENDLVDAIFVGADRIVLNGDTANKVGTANLSILAKYFDIPFYTVAPLSSFDASLENGKLIEVELRDSTEITKYKEHSIAPLNASAFNPSFDITRAENLTGIICEKALLKYPYTEKIKEVMNE